MSEPARAVAETPAEPVLASRASLLDFVTLAKPRITLEVLFTTAGGLVLAGATHRPWHIAAFALVGTALIVAGSNTLNMWYERDTDALMERTRNRPLPSGRMAPETALAFGIALVAMGVPLLALGINVVTGVLGAAAVGLYVGAYTPLKRRSWLALIVGAVPGAIPPLLGWTAVTGRPSLPGLVLFAILFTWQVPHFLAISMFRSGDYRAAGLKTLPDARGFDAAKRHGLGWVAALVASSLLLVPLGVAGTPYLVAAAGLGAAFLVSTAWGLRSGASPSWPRRNFQVSLLYLTALFVVLLATGGGPR